MVPLARAIGELSGTLFVLLVVVTIVLAYAMPLMWFSAVRNLAKSRRALERIADALDRGERPSGGGVLGI